MVMQNDKYSELTRGLHMLVDEMLKVETIQEVISDGRKEGAPKDLIAVKIADMLLGGKEQTFPGLAGELTEKAVTFMITRRVAEMI